MGEAKRRKQILKENYGKPKEFIWIVSDCGFEYSLMTDKMAKALLRTQKDNSYIYNVFLVKNKICYNYDIPTRLLFSMNINDCYFKFKDFLEYSEQNLSNESEGIWINFLKGDYPLGWYFSKNVYGLDKMPIIPFYEDSNDEFLEEISYE